MIEAGVKEGRTINSILIKSSIIFPIWDYNYDYPCFSFTDGERVLGIFSV